MPQRILTSRRVVIKAGTSILTSKDGSFSRSLLNRLGSEIQGLKKTGREVALVSSGAIALGMEIMGIKKRPKVMSKLQACAAIGQGQLMHAYENFFSKRSTHAAQVLLTRDGLEDRDRFLKAGRTLDELIRMGVIPVINENDTVATEEIAFGDNDILSVYVAHLVKADLLVILSDVSGFYLKDGTRIRLVSSRMEVEEELPKHLRDSAKEKTVGGMRAKLKAVLHAMRLGIPLLIVNGHDPQILAKVFNGEDVGTLFLPSDERKSSREMWIAFAAPRKGAMVVDDGAFQALKSRKSSLLPAGIAKIRGDFDKGQVVELEALNGRVFGRGISRHSSGDLTLCLGKKRHEILLVLGPSSPEEAVHRNDMVLWE